MVVGLIVWYSMCKSKKQAHSLNGDIAPIWQSDARNGPLTPGGCRLTTIHYPLTVAPAARRIATIPSCPAGRPCEGRGPGIVAGQAHRAARREQQLDHVGHVVPGGPREGSRAVVIVLGGDRRSCVEQNGRTSRPCARGRPRLSRATGRAAGLCAASSAGWVPCRFQATAAASRDR